LSVLRSSTPQWVKPVPSNRWACAPGAAPFRRRPPRPVQNRKETS
jgi:hypothetical protein